MKNNLPNNITIQQYLDGKLDPKLMHELEKQALEDPFLSDALEGYTHIPDAGHGLSILQRQLHECIAHLQENKKVYDLTWQRLSVAAAAAVLFIAAGLLFWMNSQKPETKLAANQKQNEVTVSPADTAQHNGNSVASIAHTEAKKANNTVEPTQTIPAKAAMRSKTQVAEAQRAKKSVPDKELVLSSAPVNAFDSSGNNAFDSSGNKQPVLPADKRFAAAPYFFKQKSDSQQLKNRADTGVHVNTSQNMFTDIGVTQPQPVSGWAWYGEYLHENNRLLNDTASVQGAVIVGFKVNNNGSLADFVIISRLSDKQNDEAIRLIKDGPKWQPAANGKVPQVRVKVPFN